MKKMKRLVSLVLALAMVMTMVLGMGVTASAETNYTITIENSVTGSTYSAYKVFDATYDTNNNNVSYTITSTDAWYKLVSGQTVVNDGTNDIVSPFDLAVTTTSGTYNVSLKSGVSDEDVAAWFNAITASQLNDADITATTTETGTGSSLVLDVGAPGYYYITTTTGSTVTVTTAAPTATVRDKDSIPGGDLDKTVLDTTAQIGDTVTYTITASVPTYADNGTKIEEYKFTDTLDAGLTVSDASAVTVQILKPDITGSIPITDKNSNSQNYSVFTTLANDGTNTYITVTGGSDSKTVITVTYNPTTITDYPADAVIMITYTATVNANAVYSNGNTVNMTWTGDNTGATDEETVYTYGFNLWKVSKKDTTSDPYTTDDLLNGAEFTLTEENGTTPIGFIKSVDSNNDVTYTVSTDTSAAGYTTTITVGSALIFGLDAETTYTLTETKAPDGFNLLTSNVSVTVGATGSYNTSTGINSNATIVENSAGSVLPGTGGIGTTIFYIIGGILVAGAAVLLITRRRMRRV